MTFMKVTGKGNLNLPQQKLDYDMTATMTASTKLAGCTEMDKLIGQSFPLDIGGTITDPKVMPDFGELAKSLLGKKVEDELKNKLLDKLGGKSRPRRRSPERTSPAGPAARCGSTAARNRSATARGRRSADPCRSMHASRAARAQA